MDNNDQVITNVVTVEEVSEQKTESDGFFLVYLLAILGIIVYAISRMYPLIELEGANISNHSAAAVLLIIIATIGIFLKIKALTGVGFLFIVLEVNSISNSYNFVFNSLGNGSLKPGFYIEILSVILFGIAVLIAFFRIKKEKKLPIQNNLNI